MYTSPPTRGHDPGRRGGLRAILWVTWEEPKEKYREEQQNPKWTPPPSAQWPRPSAALRRPLLTSTIHGWTLLCALPSQPHCPPSEFACGSTESRAATREAPSSQTAKPFQWAFLLRLCDRALRSRRRTLRRRKTALARILIKKSLKVYIHISGAFICSPPRRPAPQRPRSWT